MKHILHKWFWIWNYDKEENWLNEMAAKGLHLTDVGFCKYTFEEGTPGAYSIRLELLNNVVTHKKSIEYIHFIEETGAEYIGSIARWTYFRKKIANGSFDMFSDIDSRISHLKRILVLIGVVGAMELYCGAINSIFCFLETGSQINLFSSVLCTSFAALILYGFVRVFHKYSKLKKERLLHE